MRLIENLMTLLFNTIFPLAFVILLGLIGASYYQFSHNNSNGFAKSYQKRETFALPESIDRTRDRLNRIFFVLEKRLARAIEKIEDNRSRPKTP